MLRAAHRVCIEWLWKHCSLLSTYIRETTSIYPCDLPSCLRLSRPARVCRYEPANSHQTRRTRNLKGKGKLYSFYEDPVRLLKALQSTRVLKALCRCRCCPNGKMNGNKASILSGVSVHPTLESAASDPNPRQTFMARISRAFYRYAAYLRPTEREPRPPAQCGKAGSPSSLSTLDKVVARKLTMINASLAIRCKQVYLNSHHNRCVTGYGARNT
jgi:hypothetical protein